MTEPNFIPALTIPAITDQPTKQKDIDTDFDNAEPKEPQYNPLTNEIYLYTNSINPIFDFALTKIADGQIETSLETAEQARNLISTSIDTETELAFTITETEGNATIYLTKEAAKRLLQDKDFYQIISSNNLTRSQIVTIASQGELPNVPFVKEPNPPMKPWGKLEVNDFLFSEKYIRELVFNLASTASRIPEVGPKERIRIHEMTHYDQAKRYDSLEYDLLHAIEKTNQTLKKLPASIINSSNELIHYQRTLKELNAIKEAEAILHEVFGSHVINNNSNFAIESLAGRFAVLLSGLRHFDGDEDGNTDLEFDIQDLMFGSRVNNLTSEHNFGILLLLFGEKILSDDNPDRLFDLGRLLTNEEREGLDKKTESRLVICKVIERIEEILSDPEKFAGELLDQDRLYEIRSMHKSALKRTLKAMRNVKGSTNDQIAGIANISEEELTEFEQRAEKSN